MSGLDVRWVAVVHGVDRTGTLTAIAGVFSSRGVGFESFATTAASEGLGEIVVVFTASDRLQRVLVRTLERLAATRSVLARPADDPRVRAAAVVRAPGFRPAPDAPVTWSAGDHAADGPVLVEGQLEAVEAVVAAARAAGATQVAAMVLPFEEPDEP
ncbi:hypothetical protein [Luteimicrobium subarcticum]|uniref:ACT domain-containing protein n=1 Tax=Luteimicrobium subarcticum TaxID=620910 RepID=A0A2M8W482_9MICO|nr:hypothetical protein [Luteimicrobium subarcticum]PJI85718.1 hypothetical protein CLV34_2908 [Luteimicrobium subarcticum]